MTTPWEFNLAHTINTTAQSYKKSDEAQYGLLFHEVMAQIEVPQDIAHALTQSKAKELLSEAKYMELKKQIEQLVHHKALKAFFNPANRVYCERPLLTASGKIVRPDRFVVTNNNEVYLLDYKTGAPKNEHKDQVYEYARILEKNMLIIKQILIVYVEKRIFIKEV